MIKRVAYFCMEYGLDERFNIYSGGLGILAADVLKASKDLGLPVVGIGMLWRQGYVCQRMDENGFPYDSFYEQNRDFVEDTGVVVSVMIRGREVKCKVWKCEAFGNAPLYLLDTFLPENADKFITGQLYGWFSEERLAQEMVLGRGGVRALRALGIDVDIYHLNDSHPVMAGLELIEERMARGESFKKAYQHVREQIVFTTHTPVIAGNESYDHDILKYMGVYGRLSHKRMKLIGSEPFSMTVAGLRLSKAANAVSQLHAQTARKMWRGAKGAAPIIGVTNGVHTGTWQADSIAKAKTADELIQAHLKLKNEMIAHIKALTGVELNTHVLTIGFARRAAPYKRSDLIFTDEALIGDLLRNGKLQLIFSGKAHPNDMEGKRILANLYDRAKQYPNAVVFLENYDMRIGKLLTRGCDAWLNNPIRPLEASGTSGMKAAMNGVLNISVLDGWWPEGCEDGVNGWQIGGGYEGADTDKHDAKALYARLINDVLPCYGTGKWTEMMRRSIDMAIERFSAARMVKDYYAKLY